MKYCNNCLYRREGNRCHRPTSGTDAVTGEAYARRTNCYSERARTDTIGCGYDATHFVHKSVFMRWFTSLHAGKSILTRTAAGLLNWIRGAV